MAEETVILHFEVDQAKAERQLEKIEGLLLDNKKAQQDLTKAYKDGNITQEEYVKENIRLQQNVKKEQDQKKVLLKTLETESNSRNAIRQRISELVKQYDNLNLKTDQGKRKAAELQKELTKLNKELTKGDKAAGLFKNQIGNYPQQFAEAAKSINVAGVSIGDITGKLGAFLNPATAVVGVLGGLIAAYGSSAAGSRDLQKATDELAAGFTIAANNYGNFVKSLTENDEREGLLEQGSFLINRILYGTGTANQASAIADAMEELRQLEISLQLARGFAKDFERNAEIARRKRDDDAQATEDRLKETERIEQELTRAGQIRTVILQEQAKLIRYMTDQYELNRDAQLVVAGIESEIRDIQEEITGKLTENVSARRELLKLRKEELSIAQMQAFEANKPLGSGGSEAVVDLSNPFNDQRDLTADVIKQSQERQKQFIAELKTVEFTEKQKREFYIETAEIQKQIDAQAFQAALDFSSGLAVLFKEQTAAYKVFASAETILSTYSAATKAYEAAFTPPTAASPALGAAYAGLAIANGLANLAKINGVGFAEGGWTGPGDKYDVAGVVHADEYVVPKHVNNSLAAQPHLAALEKMRGGYADGGFVVNQSTASSQQALIMANAMKNMPQPVVSVVEITRNQKRVAVKENLSTLNR